MDITRVVTLTSEPSDADGVRSQLLTDNGFKCVTVERPWLDDKPDVSSIPRGRRYRCVWEYSEHHKRFLYHLYGDDARKGVEIHAANVFEQLLGCLAPGASFGVFAPGSAGKLNGVTLPTRAMKGVIASGVTLEAFHAAMKNPVTNEQAPFWLDIK